MAQSREDELSNEDSQFERNPGIDDGLGQCYQALEDFASAFDNYNRALKRDIDNSEFLMHRSSCYFEKEKKMGSAKF